MSSVKFESIGEKDLSEYLSDAEDIKKHKRLTENYKIISSTWCPHFSSGKGLEESKRDVESVVKETYIEEFVEKIKLIPVCIATIDLGHMNIEEFNHSYFAKVLNKHGISYFTLGLPHFEKEHFLNQLFEIQTKFNELLAKYNSLKDRNSPSAQELSYLIDSYSNEITEVKRYINQKIRTDAITTKMMQVVKNLDSKELTIIHFGDEKTFAEIEKRAEEQNIKSSILFIQKSKFLSSIN